MLHINIWKWSAEEVCFVIKAMNFEDRVSGATTTIGHIINYINAVLSRLCLHSSLKLWITSAQINEKVSFLAGCKPT